jgi:tetratricopeptide (TPR) repeat protein
MQEAGQAATEGSKERARDIYRTAAKTYPTSKEPWLKLAEDYFEATNYGQAILASQEVLQRDPTDSVATSVLAVSGLRVSASALSMLRQQQRTLNGGTRTEAEDLAKVLRELLGEPVLVPSAKPAASPVANRPRAARPAAAAPAPAASPAPKPAAPSNPFDTLKK